MQDEALKIHEAARALLFASRIAQQNLQRQRMSESNDQNFDRNHSVYLVSEAFNFSNNRL